MANSSLIHIPKSIIPIVEIEGREFFFNREKFQFQCAKCLHIMQIVPGPYDSRRSRALYIDPYCFCQTMSKEESGPIHSMTPKDFKDEEEKPVTDRVKHLITDENESA